MLTNKEILFFILVFVIIFSASKGAVALGPKLKLSGTIALLLTTFTGTVILLIVYKLSQNNGENFSFQVSGPKLCQGYPYMQSSASPELQKYCHHLMSTPEGQHEYAQMNCGNGFHGRPVHWSYTPESDHNWENTRCDSPLNANEPCVL